MRCSDWGMTTRTQICQTLPRSLARSVVKQFRRLLLGGAILVAGCERLRRAAETRPDIWRSRRSNAPTHRPLS